MGKKRIKTIDLSAKEKPHSAKASRGKGKKSGSPGGTIRRIVKSGKQHGRIADMGAVMLEEMKERAKEEEKVVEKKPKEKKLKKKVSRPPKIRSRRYQALRKLIKADKLYPLPEAIELIKKMANAHFEETVELHLVTLEPGVLTKNIKTEKKFPLAHIKIGKLSLSKTELLQSIQTLVKAIGVNRIKKAVLTSTMSPGIKIALDDPGLSQVGRTGKVDN